MLAALPLVLGAPPVLAQGDDVVGEAHRLQLGVEAVDEPRVLGGDTNAFAYLLERHERLVLKIAARHVPADRVEEIAQDAFVKAFSSLKKFRKEADKRFSRAPSASMPP